LETEDYPVGQGPLYEPLREIAKSLIPLFNPSGDLSHDSNWSLGSFMSATEFVDTHCKINLWTGILSGFDKEGNKLSRVVSSEELRTIGIGLLVLAEDMERENE
jgi:hypothetical protein